MTITELKSDKIIISKFKINFSLIKDKQVLRSMFQTTIGNKTSESIKVLLIWTEILLNMILNGQFLVPPPIHHYMIPLITSEWAKEETKFQPSSHSWEVRRMEACNRTTLKNAKRTTRKILWFSRIWFETKSNMRRWTWTILMGKRIRLMDSCCITWNIKIILVLRKISSINWLPKVWEVNRVTVVLVKWMLLTITTIALWVNNKVKTTFWNKEVIVLFPLRDKTI